MHDVSERRACRVVESFNGSFRDECWNVNWFLSTQNARTQIEAWRHDYNEFRPHGPLGEKTPEPFKGSGDWVPRVPT
jgi:transposase InsO family protein